ncbi:MAG TPA: hypothetical protein EYG83_05025 [Sulfurospirillum arcachonense]|nr:hypothetical protein [Sulfurospirillum arcachonense]
MKIKEFFKNTKKTLGINPSDEDISKKERLEELLLKLENSKNELKKELKNSDLEDERKVEIEDEIAIYKLQIKKGQEILERKNNK